MIHYKKIMAVAVLLIFLSISIYMIYRVNTVFPNPENRILTEGGESRYLGLKLTAGKMEICSEDELIRKYPDAGFKEYFENGNTEDEAEYNYILVHVILENDGNETISFGKFGSINMWTAEVGLEGQGVPLSEFLMLNPAYSTALSAGSKQDVIIPFAVPDYWVSAEELKNNTDIKIVYSYYPTKNYIFYDKDLR